MSNYVKGYGVLTREEQIELLKKELSKIEHEINISKLIYSFHGCDSYEDIFRDNIPRLEDKKSGIEVAIKNATNNYSDSDSE
jgi:hypothetical protein